MNRQIDLSITLKELRRIFRGLESQTGKAPLRSRIINAYSGVVDLHCLLSSPVLMFVPIFEQGLSNYGYLAHLPPSIINSIKLKKANMIFLINLNASTHQFKEVKHAEGIDVFVSEPNEDWHIKDNLE